MIKIAVLLGTQEFEFNRIYKYLSKLSGEYKIFIQRKDKTKIDFKYYIIDDYNSPLLYALEEILFKGKTHSKRGSGLTTIPEKVLKFDVCEGINIKKEIKELFIYHFRESLRRYNETKSTEEKLEIS